MLDLYTKCAWAESSVSHVWVSVENCFSMGAIDLVGTITTRPTDGTVFGKLFHENSIAQPMFTVCSGGRAAQSFSIA